MRSFRSSATVLTMALLLVLAAVPAAAQSGDQYCDGQYVPPDGDCDSTVVIILPPLPAPLNPVDPGEPQEPGDPSAPGDAPGNTASPLPGEAPDGTVFVELPDGTVVSFDSGDIIKFIEAPGSGDEGQGVVVPEGAVSYMAAGDTPESLDVPSGAIIQDAATIAEAGVDEVQQSGAGSENSARASAQDSTQGSAQEDQPQISVLPDTGGPALPLIALAAFGICAVTVVRNLFRTG